MAKKKVLRKKSKKPTFSVKKNVKDIAEFDDEEDDVPIKDEPVEDGDSDEESYNEEEEESEEADEASQHKKALSKLQDTDPEFYKFLEENDRKLLQFDVSDSEGEEDQDDTVHKPPEGLEVDSDEEDYEANDVSRGGDVVTLGMVAEWRKKLVEDPSVESISNAIKAFNAALDRVSGEESSVLKVDSSAVFNNVIQMCVMHLHPSVVSFLKITNKKDMRSPDKCKKWGKIKSLLLSYFSDLLKILSGVSSEHIVSVILKHFHTFCPFVACYSKLSKQALRVLTKLWSTGAETVRVLAFLCILRLCLSQKSGLLNTSLKLLYIAYIRSSKFVSISSLPQISFMRRSLAGLFTLNPSLSYQHAFLYIRQLAIHLRNAVTIHKKESFQAVYNWQYMHSLRLWVDLLCSAKESQEMQQLLYPLVQIIIGCIKLIPTGQYVPLRFHCVELLIKLGRETGTFIPTLPFIVEALSRVDKNKRHKKVSMKPFDFTCILRISKSAMAEGGFSDAIVENVFRLTLEACTAHSHCIFFPDLVVPTLAHLREFVKDCQQIKYSAKIKQLIKKLEENAKYVGDERNKLTLKLSDQAKLDGFESKLLGSGTPLLKFYEQWSKVNRLQKAKKASAAMNEYNEVYLPVNKVKKEKRKLENDDEKGPPELFPSSDEDSDVKPIFEEEEEEEEPKKKKRKIKQKKKPEVPVEVREETDDASEADDIVEDLDLDKF